MKKLSIVLIVLIAVGALIYGFWFKKNQGEFLDVDGYVSTIGNSADWPLFEGKNDVGTVVYTINKPVHTSEKETKYVEFSDEEWFKPFISNKVVIRIMPRLDNSSNIDEYMSRHAPKSTNDPRDTMYYGEMPTMLGQYRAYKIRSSDGGLVEHRTLLYFLTESGVVEITLDHPNGCIEWDPSEIIPKGDPRESLEICKKYFAVYMPIVEKILSMFTLEQYRDNRGFVPPKSFSIKDLFKN